MSEAVDHLEKGFSNLVNAPLKAASSAYDTVVAGCLWKGSTNPVVVACARSSVRRGIV